MEIKYDQHFLNSKNVLLLEKNFAQINNEDIIFEIGPGDGRLSHFLLEGKPKKLISVEMDKNFENNLFLLQKKYNNFEYIIGNGLKELKKQNFNKLVSNIPYSITEPLYTKILEKKIPFVLLLHGITFYKIISDFNSKWYWYINSTYNIEMLKEVAGNAFEPATKTMSVLIRLTLKKEINNLDKFIQILFSKKDRSVKNTLIYSFVDYFKISKKKAKEIYNKLDINENKYLKKFENLSNLDFIEILEKIKNLIK